MGAERARGRGSSLERLGLILLALTLILPPLLVWPTLHQPFRLPKLVASELLGLLSALCLLAAGGASTLQLPASAAAWLRLPAVRTAGPFVLLATTGLLTSAHAEHVRSGVWSLWVAFTCLVVWSLLGSRLRRMLNLLLIPAVLLSLVGILQYHDLYRPFAFSGGEEGRRLGLTSLAGSVGDLGTYLVLPALLAQAGLARALRGRGRPATVQSSGKRRGRKRKGRSGRTSLFDGRLASYAAALLIVGYAILVGQVLTALAALAVGSVLLWGLLLPRSRRWQLAVGSVLLLVLVVSTVPSLRQRALFVRDQLERGSVEDALSGRTDGWRTALWMARQRPIVGVGHGAFVAEHNHARLDLIDDGVEMFQRHRAQSTFGNAHNEYLEVLAETGILGLGALLWGLGALFVQCRRRFAASQAFGERLDRALAWSALAALGVLCLAYFPLRIALTAYPLLVLLGWILRPSPGPSDERRDSASRTAVGTLALVLVGVLSVLAVVRGARHLEASRTLRSIELASLQMVQEGRVSRTALRTYIRRLEEIGDLDPANFAIPMAIGSQYFLLGDDQSAVEWYGRALEIEPRPEIYLNLSRALERSGDSEGAAQNRLRARQLDPLGFLER